MAVPASNSAQACLEGSFTPMSEATRLPDSASYPVYDPPLSRMPAPGHLPAALSLSSLRNPLPLLPRGERYLGVEIELMLTDKSLEATSMLLKLIGYPHGGVRAWKTGYRVNDGLRALIAIALGQPEEVVSKGEQTYQEWAVKLDGSISVPRSSSPQSAICFPQDGNIRGTSRTSYPPILPAQSNLGGLQGQFPLQMLINGLPLSRHSYQALSHPGPSIPREV